MSRAAKRSDVTDESDVERKARWKTEHAAYMARRHEMFMAFFRLASDAQQLSPKCPRRDCRRLHKCGGGPDFPCREGLVLPQYTNEEVADAMVELKRGLERKLRAAEEGKGLALHARTKQKSRPKGRLS